MSKPTTPGNGDEPTAAASEYARARTGRSTVGDAAGRAETERDGYVVRPYRPNDKEQFFELYEAVFGEQRTDEWFSWRYGGPYADRPRMFVAERAGELVGAEPFISFGMRAGDETTLAIQPADAMVHPDHRRNGLLTRMTERALEHFGDREPSFVFNFPNEEAKGAYLKLGWVEVGSVATAYRIQNPSRFFSASSANLDAVASTAADAGATAFHRVRDAVRTTDGSIDVRRHDGVPAGRLASLYGEAVPERIHTPRTTAFLDWRYANPNWDARTYTAHRGGDLLAALVTVDERGDGLRTKKVLDGFPLVGQRARSNAFSALLSAVIGDADDADIVTVGADTLPNAVLSEHGFYWDDRPPLSLLGSLTTVVARPLSLTQPTDWTVGNCDLPERRDWRLPLAEQDCSS
ncbi:Ribosomal protein S18 acetylase RimI [Natronoarchaeum philippinense]|uniref:Ribosomal protein S18 acetylase RimI n=1 Tax=Natronoarchaeum philippinense TaxID=558529 RepID=A0A285N5E5_NATPI|nr:GNAT family N-acetyltransferase [Natronoarchaeum philippinense]SNZ04695.1 Ribosomal protein S18 acetylase RimI [Natronoarchaeum philippinense]